MKTPSTIVVAAASIVLLAADSRSFAAPPTTPSSRTAGRHRFPSSVSGSAAASSSSSSPPPPSPPSSSLLRSERSAASFRGEDLELTRIAIVSHAKTTTTGEGGWDVPPSSRDEAPSDRPRNDLMMRAALGRSPVERTPVWLFRQAGRHLPEYREYKARAGRSFLDMLSRPEDVAECTLQPVRRYGVDAAILFSDILVVAEAMNVEVSMPGGVGIFVPFPLVGPADMRERLPPASSLGRDFVRDRLGHVMESVRLIRSKMREEGMSVPLIGFSAAPWTLLFYMVGGSSKKNRGVGMEWLVDHPEASRELLDMLTTVVVEYMSEQVESGAHMLQLFEAMGMMIGEEEFGVYALPCLEKIASELKARHPDVPLMVFARGASHANGRLSEVGYDVVTIDGDVDRAAARGVVGGRAGLQGNYDPRELVAEDGRTAGTVRRSARDMLEALGPQRLIANLGEGLGGGESPELVAAFVDAIHEESERMIRG
jgi:uroporphyrinogen decarboxylase